MTDDEIIKLCKQCVGTLVPFACERQDEYLSIAYLACYRNVRSCQKKGVRPSKNVLWAGMRSRIFASMLRDARQREVCKDRQTYLHIDPLKMMVFQEAINSLSPQLRELYELRFVEQRKIKELSERFGISKQALSCRINHLRRTLKRKLTKGDSGRS